jgi:hypothetical protein
LGSHNRARRPRGPSGDSGAAAEGGPEDDLFGPGCLGLRIRAAAYAAVGCLPRELRGRASHLWEAGNLQRLTAAMMRWIHCAEMEAERFAALFFGRAAGDPKVTLLHGAALDVSSAGDHRKLSEAAEKLATALQAIGLDCWPRFLAELSDRAVAPETTAALEHCERNDEHSGHPAGTSEGPPPVPSAPGGRNAGDPSTVDGPAGRPPPAHAQPATGSAAQIRGPRQSGGGTHRRALPPPDIVPPVRNPGRLTPGVTSRTKEAWFGGNSLWDEDGGEWRYIPSDRWGRSYWDYNGHAGPNSPWQKISANISPQ